MTTQHALDTESGLLNRLFAVAESSSTHTLCSTALVSYLSAAPALMLKHVLGGGPGFSWSLLWRVIRLSDVWWQ